MAQKWNELALACSLAIVSAVGMFLMGIFGYTGVYGGMVNMMTQFHMYFAVTPFGIIAGMIEAAVWGFVAGYAIAWIYNKFA
jgi:formate hydrogenlyase subunit 3/multisubunit Na+/H+ antiporter MnhD subunit